MGIDETVGVVGEMLAVEAPIREWTWTSGDCILTV
jgi:hypothetical protein